MFVRCSRNEDVKSLNETINIKNKAKRFQQPPLSFSPLSPNAKLCLVNTRYYIGAAWGEEQCVYKYRLDIFVMDLSAN